MIRLAFSFRDGTSGRMGIVFTAEGVPMRGHLLEGRMPESLRERFSVEYSDKKSSWNMTGIRALVTESSALARCGVGRYGIQLLP